MGLVIEYNVGGTGTDFWLFPIDIAVGPFPDPPIGLPLPQIPDLGHGPFDVGFIATFICPGYPTCGRKYGACTYTIKKIWQFDPLDFLPVKFPQLPSAINFPSFFYHTKFPSTPFDVKHCPNYEKKIPAGGG